MAKLILIVLLVVYCGGVWKFWKGFSRTNFSGSLPNKLILALFWPPLLALNKSYRKNFQKALREGR
ncbi:MAG: hypothetical protein QNJ70_22025 [Xenococcaceae cyanobacterium MO_207.B15]|nr:hypothetical protein [Xenococcaceae cyanobacterium MO_207.B15]MDJ0742694.1 hypothetical protein [Xenococcaceae cyanobacterium MO_167.B27]